MWLPQLEDDALDACDPVLPRRAIDGVGEGEGEGAGRCCGGAGEPRSRADDAGEPRSRADDACEGAPRGDAAACCCRTRCSPSATMLTRTQRCSCRPRGVVMPVGSSLLVQRAARAFVDVRARKRLSALPFLKTGGLPLSVLRVAAQTEASSPWRACKTEGGQKRMSSSF